MLFEFQAVIRSPARSTLDNSVHRERSSERSFVMRSDIVPGALFPDYDSLSAEVAKGTVDVALMPPLAYVRDDLSPSVSFRGSAMVFCVWPPFSSSSTNFTSKPWAGSRCTFCTSL